jgi:hypothetical protein
LAGSAVIPKGVALDTPRVVAVSPQGFTACAAFRGSFSSRHIAWLTRKANDGAVSTGVKTRFTFVARVVAGAVKSLHAYFARAIRNEETRGSSLDFNLDWGRGGRRERERISCAETIVRDQNR